MPKAYIMIGVSGSGKTKWLMDKISTGEDIIICSADHYFYIDDEYKFDSTKLKQAHESCLKKFIKNCNRHTISIACDNVNSTIGEIAPYIMIAQAYGYSTHPMYVDTIPKWASNNHGVPEKVVVNMHNDIHDLRMIWPEYWPDIEPVKGIRK